MTVPANPATPTLPGDHSTVRQIVEFFTCLVIAVTLFKGYLLEGYVITTGSMAPTLLGQHKQILCPSCGHRFALGMTGGQAPPTATCPNCDQYSIDTSRVIPNEGDQLLVFKSAYRNRNPRRWEVAVFRNPSEPSIAYVKRVVGLPGEKIQIRDGDVWINNRRARKSYETQRGMRILVHDHALQPAALEEDWQPRWKGDSPNWQPRGSGFAVDTRADRKQESVLSWLTYHHWLRAGGEHQSHVPLEQWPANHPQWDDPTQRVNYDADNRVLRCRGVMPNESLQHLLGLTDSREYQDSVRKLAKLSHIAPITDFYAYNRQGVGSGGDHTVRDLLIATQLHYKGGEGELRVEMTHGDSTFLLIIDTKQQAIWLHRVGESEPLRAGRLPSQFFDRSVWLEISNFDHQILCAIDGSLVFPAVEFDPAQKRPAAIRSPVRLGVRGLRLHVHALQLYRDVYYLPEEGNEGKIWSLRNTGDQQDFFVMGDNSPISVDSRRWASDVVLQPRLLIGKPIVVHLPANTQTLRIGNWNARFRMPDLSRMRFIR